MPTIDADAHVIESESTWNYLEGHEAQFKPVLLSANHDGRAFVLKYSGENNLLIGSDYGHVDTSAEIDALKKMKTKGDVSSEVIDKILWDNPKAFYKI